MTSIDLDRRDFLKLGVAGAVTLNIAGLGGMLTGCGKREQAAAQGFRVLRDADLKLFSALLPAVVSDLPLDAATFAAALLAIDQQLAHGAKPARAKLFKLFDLLHFGPTRWLTTGVRAPWDQASPEQIVGFLDRWRNSSVGMFNAGYGALVRLSCVGYFGQPAGYGAAGYRPLPRVYAAVNA